MFTQVGTLVLSHWPLANLKSCHGLRCECARSWDTSASGGEVDNQEIAHGRGSSEGSVASGEFNVLEAMEENVPLRSKQAKSDGSHLQSRAGRLKKVDSCKFKAKMSV